MFTLKLFRRDNGQLVTKTIAVHHVQTMEIGNNRKTIEIWAFKDEYDYKNYYVGELEQEMTELNNGNHWGWGLLENWEGNTSQHYRPASYG